MLATLILSAALAATAAQPVVDAERAFAAAAQEEGVGQAFLAHAADDAIVFEPDPVPARPRLAARRASSARLVWWPVYAGMAASGDLGFTTGPFRLEADGRAAQGWYFTVWRRQADGNWRWILDHGPPTREAADEGPETPVSTLGPGTPGGDWSEVAAADDALCSALAADAPTALAAALADDGRVMRAGPQPAIGRDAFAGLLAAGPARIEARRLGGGVSAAGDLAFTYGAAVWDREGSPRKGHYVRLWQRRGERWLLVLDELIPAPGPSPAPR